MRMFYSARLWVAALVSLASVGFTSCSDELLLPRFDGGILNPDIRFLRASDVLTGVKCAVVSFLSERERELIQEREKAQHDSPNKFKDIEEKAGVLVWPGSLETLKPKFSPYALNTTWQPPCQKGYHLDLCRPKDKACISCTYRAKVEGGTIVTRPCPIASGICVPNQCNPLSSQFYDYALRSPNANPMGKRFDDAQFKGCSPVPDYSRLSIDPNQDVQTTLTLVGTNTGAISYQKIDALRLPKWLSFITAGGGPNGAPFPQLLPSIQDTTTFEILVNMAQTLHANSVPDPYPLFVTGQSPAFARFATPGGAQRSPLAAVDALQAQVGIRSKDDKRSSSAVQFDLAVIKQAIELGKPIRENPDIRPLQRSLPLVFRH